MTSHDNEVTTTKKVMDKNLDSGPNGLEMAQNGPKLENRTTPSVFELQFSNAQIVLTLPCPKNCWTKILIQGPVLGLWGPKNGQNFKIFVFGRRGFKFSEGIHICYMKSFMQ